CGRRARATSSRTATCSTSSSTSSTERLSWVVSARGLWGAARGVLQCWRRARRPPPRERIRLHVSRQGVATDSTAGRVIAHAGHGRSVPRAVVPALPYLGTAVAVLAMGLPTLILPFWPDQAIFSLIGKRIAEGGFPYVDAWDQKPPSIYFIYAVAIRGPFDLTRNLRLFDLAWTLATALVLFELGRRWWTVRAGVIAGVGYGAVYVTMSDGWARLAQPDSFIGLPLALALLMVEAARGRRGVLITAGLPL